MIPRFKEGEFIKITFLDLYEYSRNYLLVVWPHRRDIRKQFCNDYHGTSPLIINMEGELGYEGFGFVDDSRCKFSKPNLRDMLEISQLLKSNGLVYNRKTRKVIDTNKKG